MQVFTGMSVSCITISQNTIDNTSWYFIRHNFSRGRNNHHKCGVFPCKQRSNSKVVHKQSGHNDNSPTKINSIHHKVVINTGRVERIDSMSYEASCNCEMRLDEDEDGADVGDDVDDDLDDARDDGDDDGDDLPFREVISSAESSRRRALFFSVGFRHGAAAELRKTPLFRVFG